ncbi:MAG: hypothetical protein ACR2FG_13350 [Marmoricola sp.]
MTGVTQVDPFDLPDWLGTGEVTWLSPASIHHRHLVVGALNRPPDGAAEELPCDLMAVDQAYPEAVLDEQWRSRAHREWTHDQVLLLQMGDRLTLAVPGTQFTADRVLEVIGRLAKTVGARPERFTVALRP